MTVGWSVVLHNIALIGGDDAPTGTTTVGCISEAPDGLGVPPLRTEDVTFPQVDGVTHFFDWYQPRIVTVADASVCADGCPACPSHRQKMAQLMGAWSRHCDDTELVIFTDCHDPDAAPSGRVFTGPYGVIGRPRVATSRWIPGTQCGVATLRFDGIDHRLYILDGDGTPGSGEVCVTLSPVINANCRTYPRCYDTCSVGATGGMAYTVAPPATGGSGPQDLDNYGTLCAPMTVTLTGPLTSPTVQNQTTGEAFTYTGVITTGQIITVDTSQGTAFDQDGIARTYLLTGDTRWQLDPGVNTIRLTSQNSSDSGTGQVCFRPAVLSA